MPTSQLTPDQLAAIREAAWTGQHAKAIELAAHALDQPKIKPVEQMGLLDLRAEAYIAQGQLDLAARDAEAMQALALRAGKATLKVQALNRMALVQMRAGELKAAVKTAQTAVNTKHPSASLRAESLFRLSEAQMRTGLYEEGLATADSALGLLEAADDKSGPGRVQWVKALCHISQGRLEEALRHAEQALSLCESAGDRYGIGNAYNALSNASADIAERLQYTQLAAQAFETAGYIERRSTALGNLALAYADLGLYPHSRRLQSEVVNLTRGMGAKLGLAYALGNLGEAETKHGALAEARASLQELAGIVPELGDLKMDASLAQGRGDLALAEGDARAAVRYHQASVQLCQRHGMTSENIALTQLGRAYLASGDVRAALAATTRATDLHRDLEYALPDGYPAQGIWWAHAEALLANQQTEAAWEALETAHSIMLAAIAHVRDEGLRRNYLNKVAINRELLQFWVQEGARRKLPKARLYAHLAIESSVREPFQRLVDTGLRLNALHTVAEIQAFLLEEAIELSGAERLLLIREQDGQRTVLAASLPPEESAPKVLRSIKPLLDQARLARAVQLVRPRSKGRSRIVAPLIAQNQIMAYLYVDLDGLYGAFNEVDRDMLGLLANQAAVAWANAQWSQGLEQKVAERTEALQASNANLAQRNSELAIINSVQAGLAAKLDFQGIIELVGDKLREIFAAENLSIRLVDRARGQLSYPYVLELGQRVTLPTTPLNPQSFAGHIVATRRPFLVNEDMAQMDAQYGAGTIPGTGDTLAFLGVPILAGPEAIGLIVLESFEEHAFTDSDVRLLSTLAGSLGVALENARLFDETQRLFKAEQQRAAELAIINSVQDGLAAKLEFQGIIDLVGDKLVEIFQAENLSIRLYDRQQNLLSYPYFVEHGQRLNLEPRPLVKNFTYEIITTRRPFLVNDNMDTVVAQFGGGTLPGTDDTRAFLGVPILAGAEAIGAITLESFDEQAFSESDVRLLSTIAASLGTALENARLFDETQRLFKAEQQRAAELAIINSVQQGLAAQLEFQAIIDLVGDRLAEILHSGDIGIRLYDHDRGLVTYPYEFEHGQRLSVAPTPVPAGGFARHVLDTGQPLLVLRMEDWRESVGRQGGATLPGTDESQSAMVVPIPGRSKPMGLIVLENYERENAYSESDLRLLTTLAASLSVALENARLFGETRRLLEETEQRAAELAIINSVQQGLAAQLDMQAIYDLVGDKIREIFQQSDMCIRIYDPLTNLVHYRYMYEFGQRLTIEPLPLSDHGFEHHVLRTRETVVVNENMPEAVAKYGSYNIPGTESEKSAVYVPLVAGDQARGLISLADMHREQAYSEADVRLLQTLANSMSVALENARLFDETQRLLKETEQRAAELAIINSVQEGLVAQLDFQGIVDLVGDRLRDILHTGDIGIRQFDPATGLAHFLYEYEHGQRLSFEPAAPTGATRKVLESGQPLLVPDSAAWARATGAEMMPGTDASKSFVAVPIPGRQRVMGMIIIEDYERLNAYGEADVRLLSTLAASMSVALENARLFSETKRLLSETEQRAAELAVINSIQQGLASKLDFQGIIDLVGDQLRDILHTGDIGIRLYDRETRLVHFVYEFEHGRRVLLNENFATQPLTETVLARQVIESGQPLVIESAEQFLSTFGRRSLIPGTDTSKSAVAVPILTRGQPTGLINVESHEREAAFGESDVRLLTTLAGSLSVALENARLFEQTKRLLDETQQRAGELAIINSLSQALAAELDLNALTVLIGEQLRQIFSADIVYVALHDRAAGLIRFPYYLENGQQRGNDPIAYGRGMTSRILEQRQPLLLNREEDYTALNIARVGTRSKSYVGVPILTGAEAIGVVSVQSTTREGQFGPDDLRLLTTVAANIGVAIRNAQLYDEVKRRASETAALAEVGREISASLDLPVVLDAIASRARDLLRADTSAVFLPEAGGQSFRAIVAQGVNAQEIKDDSIIVGQGIIGTLAAQGQAEAIADTGVDARAVQIPGTVEPVEPERLMAAPLLIRDQVGGMMAVWRTGGDAFGLADLNFLVGLSRQAAIAIENARLFAEAQRRAEETAALAEIGREISATLDLNTVLERIATRAQDLLRARDVVVRLLEPDGSLPVMVA